MRVSIMPSLLKDLGRLAKKIFFILKFALPLGILIAVLCLSQAHAQNYQSPQLTLVDSIDISGGTITSTDLHRVETQIRATADKMLDLNDTKIELQKTLVSLYKLSSDVNDKTIILLEKDVLEKTKEIEQCRMIIIATCEKLSGITVVSGRGKRSSKYLYSGVQTLMDVEDYLEEWGL